MNSEMEFYYTKNLEIYRIQPGKTRFEKHVYHIATGTTEANAMELCKILAFRAEAISDLEESERDLLFKLDGKSKIIANLKRELKAK